MPLRPFKETSIELLGRAQNVRLRNRMARMAAAIRENVAGNNVLAARKPQDKIALAIAEALEAGYRIFYIDVPGSAGKTVIATQIVRAIFARMKQQRMLYATPYIDLAEQGEESFEHFSPEIPIGLHLAHIKDSASHIITTHKSFREAFSPRDDFQYGFIDEAHHVLSSGMMEQLARFDETVWILMTATPAYSQERSLAHHFHCAYRMSIDDAVKARMITGYRNILLTTEAVNLEEIEVGFEGDYDPFTLERAVNVEARNQAIIDFLHYGQDPMTGQRILGKRVVLNCAGVAHAEELARRLCEQIKPSEIDGRAAARAVHTKKMSIKTRRDLFDAHKAGDFPILTNIRLVGEGYDDEGIEVVVNAVPTLSVLRAHQRGVRVQRIDKNNRDKMGLVVDVLDTQTLPKAPFINKMPILFGEAVGAPAIYDRRGRLLLSRFRSQKTVAGERGKRMSLKVYGVSGRVKVLWDDEDVKVLLDERMKAREQAKPIDREEYPPLRELVRELDSSYLTVRAILARMKPVKGKQNIAIDPVNKMQWQIKTDVVPPCLHISEYARFKEAYQFDIPAGTAGVWVTGTEIARLYSSDDNQIDRHTVMAILKRMEKVEGIADIRRDPKKGGIWRVEPRRVNRHTTPCLHVDDLEKFAAHYHLDAPIKTDEWLSPADIQNELNVSVPKVYAIIERLQKVEGVGTRYKDKLTGEIWRMDYFKSGPGIPLCLHRSDLKRFKDIYQGASDKKTAEWLSAVDLMQVYSIRHQRVMNVLNGFHPVKNKPEYMRDPATGKQWRVKLLRAGVHSTRCLHKNEVQAFGEAYGFMVPLKTSEWLSPSDISEKLGVGVKTIQKIIRVFSKIKDEEESFRHTGTRSLWRAAIRRSPENTLCLHEDELKRFEAVFRSSRWKKPENIRKPKDLSQG